MSRIWLSLITCTALALGGATAQADDIVQWEPGPKREPAPGETVITFNEYDDSFAWDAIEHLSGARPPEDAGREAMAEHVLALLDALPAYGQKETMELRPPIPQWFLDGYQSFEPTSVQHSRYFDGVLAGSLAQQAEIATLYAHWSTYDAEWFSVVRRPAFKAWLSAAVLSYAPRWDELKSTARADLHDRLVKPLQTKDDPYKEIDNWIENFSDSPEAFIKPLVLSALAGELIARGGLETDGRFLDDEAYGTGAPAELGLSDEDFALMAALTITYFREIYDLAPATMQPLFFRDYFVERYYALR